MKIILFFLLTLSINLGKAQDTIQVQPDGIILNLWDKTNPQIDTAKLYARYEKECTSEWRLNKLIINRVWIPPIRKDWRQILEKKPTHGGFNNWLKMWYPR